MQDVWVSGVDWDEELHKEYKDTAVQWFQTLNKLPHIKLPRCFIPSGERSSFSLHLFTDAWQKAYGAVVHARWVQTNGEITSNMVMPKSRVASL